MALLVVSDYFQALKVNPKNKEKIIELTIHLEARKSAFLTFQKIQKKIDFFSDYAFVCNANENRFFKKGTKNFVIWSSGPSGKVQSVSKQFKTNWSDSEMFVVKPIHQDSLVFKYGQFFFATGSHFMFELSWFYGKREQFVFSNPVKSLC